MIRMMPKINNGTASNSLIYDLVAVLFCVRVDRQGEPESAQKEVFEVGSVFGGEVGASVTDRCSFLSRRNSGTFGSALAAISTSRGGSTCIVRRTPLAKPSSSCTLQSVRLPRRP